MFGIYVFGFRPINFLVSARNMYKQAKSKHQKKCFEILTLFLFPRFFLITPWYTVSFLFVPLLGVPFISGEANPPSISHLPNQFWNGALCWVGSAPCCCLGCIQNNHLTVRCSRGIHNFILFRGHFLRLQLFDVHVHV